MAADGDKLFRRVARLNQVSREAADALKEARETPQPLAAVDQAEARDRDAQQGLINALWNEQEARHQHWSDVRAERDQGRQERSQAPGEPDDVLFTRVEWRRQKMEEADRDLRNNPNDLTHEVFTELHEDYAKDLFDNQDAREASWTKTRAEVDGYRQERQRRLEQQRRELADRRPRGDLERQARERDAREARDRDEDGRGRER